MAEADPRATTIWEPKLSSLAATALWINSADDFINPAEVAKQIIGARVLPKMPKTRFIILPITDAIRGHGTHAQAAIWKDELAKFLGKPKGSSDQSPINSRYQWFDVDYLRMPTVREVPDFFGKFERSATIDLPFTHTVYVINDWKQINPRL